jgi:hypothetical protein
MSVNDTSRIIIEDACMMLKIVAFLTDDPRFVIYNCNMFILQATSVRAQSVSLPLELLSHFNVLTCSQLIFPPLKNALAFCSILYPDPMELLH